MELSAVKKLISKYSSIHNAALAGIQIAERYYDGRTDILFQEKDTDDAKEALHRADNRISRNFFSLLVDQKVSYALGNVPALSYDSDTDTDTLREALGRKLKKNLQKLGVDASITGVGWVHYWVDDDGRFRWGVLPPGQVQPIWSADLDPELEGVLRIYKKLTDDGESLVIYEIWTDHTCESYARKEADTLDLLTYYTAFSLPTGEATNVYEHGLGRVPFIAFWNNSRHRGDLERVKKLIDVQDKVYSGFINDLEDIQELIFILSGYGGTDLDTFLEDLKQYKVISLDGADGSVNTLSIQIPKEARESVLEATRKAIFEEGMGYDPHPKEYGEQSGTALKFMYAGLEIKVSQMQAEFEVGLDILASAIMQHTGKDPGELQQAWRRNAITNDQETAQICQQSMGVLSHRTILLNHPFVQDANAELEQIQEEKEQELETYGFGQVEPGGDDDGEGTDE